MIPNSRHAQEHFFSVLLLPAAAGAARSSCMLVRACAPVQTQSWKQTMYSCTIWNRVGFHSRSWEDKSLNQIALEIKISAIVSSKVQKVIEIPKI